MTAQTASAIPAVLDDKKVFYNRFLLIVAGLGGLLYGVDVGIIAGALPYLEATSHFSRTELSLVVAAVLLGSVISTLFAGLLVRSWRHSRGGAVRWKGRTYTNFVTRQGAGSSIPRNSELEHR